MKRQRANPREIEGKQALFVVNPPATQDRSDLFGTSSESVSRLAQMNSDIRRTIKRLFEAEQSSSDFLLRLSPTPIVVATGI